MGTDIIEWPRLGPMELVRGLTGCVTGGECEGCPLYGLTGTLECIDELRRQAAETIARLYNAEETTVEELTRRLADMAREGNTALERGLEGVNQAKLAEMTGIQSELADFGRGSVIRTEPAGRMDGSVRILEVIVEGRAVFSAECTEKESVIANQSADWCGDPVDLAGCPVGAGRKIDGIATAPAEPRNDGDLGGPDG